MHCGLWILTCQHCLIVLSCWQCPSVMFTVAVLFHARLLKSSVICYRQHCHSPWEVRTQIFWGNTNTQTNTFSLCRQCISNLFFWFCWSSGWSCPLCPPTAMWAGKLQFERSAMIQLWCMWCMNYVTAQTQHRDYVSAPHLTASSTINSDSGKCGLSSASLGSSLSCSNTGAGMTCLTRLSCGGV